ncbi:MAG: L-2-hydroxyglutarate oxidase [Planctomycetota bacterium]
MSVDDSTADFTVIGAGIVGLATAWKLRQRYQDCTVQVLEAESAVARHQSGHNSGVIHSGIYYRPGSEKARTCREGKQQLEAFCEEHDIPWDRCGKVVVATSGRELDALERISERGTQNGVVFRRINTDELRELEPNAAGIAALHVPETGIVDYVAVCEQLRSLVTESRGAVHFDSRVREIRSVQGSIEVKCSGGGVFRSGFLVNCGGLQCDRIASLAGVTPKVRIVPFRGEYYELAHSSQHLVRNLIYPVPDPAFPFLGVHFTRMIGGGIECGPNAVLALSREGYDWKSIRAKDLASTISFGGFRKLAMRHWRTGLGEMKRSLNKASFVKALQKLMPSLRDSDLVPGRAGVRAQAVTPEGSLLDDFLIQESDHAVHVMNAPSPAATASLAIADSIVDKVEVTRSCSASV